MKHLGLSSEALKVFKAWGAAGAAKRNRNLTREERRTIARKAIKARWDKVRADAKTTKTTKTTQRKSD